MKTRKELGLRVVAGGLTELEGPMPRRKKPRLRVVSGGWSELTELMQLCGIEDFAQTLAEAKKRTISENRHSFLVSEAKRVRQDGEILTEYARQRMAELESLPNSAGKFDRRARDRLRKLEAEAEQLPHVSTHPISLAWTSASSPLASLLASLLTSLPTIPLLMTTRTIALISLL